MALHLLNEVPYVPRQYLIIQCENNDLSLREADYEEICDWLGWHLIHNKWDTITGEIAACDESGLFTKFSLDGKTVVVIRTFVE